jgi:hypothetical protein
LQRVQLPEQQISMHTGTSVFRACRYYYNKWMTQRIHTALLELQLGCSLGSGTSQQLLEAAEAAADEPAIAAAAAAAGFTIPPPPAAAGTAAHAALPGPGTVEDTNSSSSSSSSSGDLMAGDCGSSSSSHAAHSSAGSQQLVELQQHPQQPQRLLQLPEPVVSKLLMLDAGDLDLMIQHPAALQAQVRRCCWGTGASCVVTHLPG